MYAGACHAHNVGVSLLHALDMRSGWIAHSVDEYVAHALAAASDVPRLALLRAGLRGRMLNSRLCDAPAFVRSLEDVYRCSLHWHQNTDHTCNLSCHTSVTCGGQVHVCASCSSGSGWVAAVQTNVEGKD